MGEPKISLMIFGTRLSTSGWEPLVMLNNPPFAPLANIGVAGVGENPTYYTFRIDQNYIQYTLVYNPKYIKAHAAQRAGALKVSIAMPKGYKLEGDASPYNVLIGLQRALEQQALAPIVGNQGAFEFKASFPSDEVFAQVLNSFRLVATKMPHRPMSLTSTEVGMIVADDSLCEKLFKDLQYPEFSKYKEIAIANIGESESMIKDLEIPRRPKYEIFVNNNLLTNRFQSYDYGYNDAIIIDTLSLLGFDKRAYEGEILEFTVNEVLNGKHSHIIRVDREKEHIYVSLSTPKKRRVKYKIVLDGCSKPDVFKCLRAYVNGKERPISAFNTIELIGEELISSNIDFKIEGRKYELKGRTSFDGTNIHVPVREIPQPKEEKAIDRWGGKSDTPGSQGDGSKRNKLIEFKLILEDRQDIKDCNKPYRVRFYNDDISFLYNRPFNSIKGDKGWYIDVTIPENWAGDYYISLKTDCVKIDPNHRREQKLGPNTKEVKITQYETVPLSWRDKLTKSTKSLLQVLILLLVLTGGAFGGIWIKDKYFHKEEGKTDVEDLVSEKETDRAKDNLYTDELTQQINKFLERLQDEAITFDEIKTINLWIDKNLSNLDENNGGLQLKDKVEGYMRVIDCIEQSKNQNVASIKAIAQQEKNHLEEGHFKYLQNVWSTGVNSKGEQIFVNRQQENAVDEELKKRPTFKSFLDIPSSKDILKPPTENPPVKTNPRGNNGKTGKTSSLTKTKEEFRD